MNPPPILVVEDKEILRRVATQLAKAAEHAETLLLEVRELLLYRSH